MRFQLANDRVQGLLMGEQLYADPKLAVRELYQNAVDACRHADARSDYVCRTVPEGSPLRASAAGAAALVGGPRISFEQGLGETGQEFIRCTDTGVGMGIEELEGAFALAGIRSTDRPEFLGELADYRSLTPPVELWTNSCFGIGVLSYFMIAERIELATCRLNRDGVVDRELRVVIAGPEAEFEVHEGGEGTQSGTSITLWLKPATQVSSVATLRDLVIVCPYSMRATASNGLHHEWSAGELNTHSSHLYFPGQPAPGPSGPVWFVNGHGAVLADGLWAESHSFGTVVNLTGDLMPTLTADRRRILSYDAEKVDQLVASVVGESITASWSVVGQPYWLDSAFRFNPMLVDAIIEAASADLGLKMPIRGAETSVNTCGYMIGDDDAQVFSDPRVSDWTLSRIIAGGGLDYHPVTAEGWSVVAARPTDAVFLGGCDETMWGLTRQPVSEWNGDALSVYCTEMHVRWPISRVVERARELGLYVSEGAEQLPETNDFIRALLTTCGTWSVESPRSIPPFLLVRVASQFGMTLGSAAQELAIRHIAIGTGWNELLRRRPTQQELVLASMNLDGVEPWRDLHTAIDFGVLNSSAEKVGIGQLEAIRSYERLGFAFDLPVDQAMIPLSTEDSIVVSRDLDGLRPFLERSQAVSTSHIKRAASLLDCSRSGVRERLERLGFVASGDSGAGGPKVRSKIDRRLVALFPGSAHRLPLDEPVSDLQVLIAASYAKIAVAEARVRLSSLGYRLQPSTLSMSRLKGRYRRIASASGTGHFPFRQQGEIILPLQIIELGRTSRRSFEETRADALKLGFIVPDLDEWLPVSRPGNAPEA